MTSVSARLVCARCHLPQRSCVCALAVPVPHASPVLVLQHPAEARHAKNTVRLLALSLAHCEVQVGETFDEAALHAMLWAPGPDGRAVQPVLLYPATPGSMTGSAPAGTSVGGQQRVTLGTRLVVLDGSWRQSRQLLRRHPGLQALPRLGLQPAHAGGYEIRRAHAPHQLSTLEAVCLALAEIEGVDPGHGAYAALRASFARFVADRQAWAAGKGPKEPLTDSAGAGDGHRPPDA